MFFNILKIAKTAKKVPDRLIYQIAHLLLMGLISTEFL